MGYRSDVMAVFYTYDPMEFPAMKLFIDEHMPEWCRDDEHMRVFKRDRNQSTLQGILFDFRNVKWYESYPDVQGFEQALKKFEKLADEGDKWLWEFVRLGENLDDVEERNSYNSEPLLYVSRSIESDI